MKVTVNIIVTGPRGSGKSLAISDMANGLKDAGHFACHSSWSREGSHSETLTFDLQLKDHHVMEHES